MTKLTEEDFWRRYKALEAELAKTLEHRYAAAFPDDPLPAMYWYQGDGPQLDRLMEGAIGRGRALTAADLLKAQDLAPPPAGAVV